NIEHMVKVSEKARIMEHKRRVQESLLILTTYTAYHSRSIRRIQDFDELKDHCLTLKNTSYPHQRYAVYNTLVNEEEPTGFTSIRRIHQEDTAYPCPNFTKTSMTRRLNTPHGQEFNWETARYGKVTYFEHIDYFKDFENEFSAIVYKDALTSEPEVSSKPTVSILQRGDGVAGIKRRHHDLSSDGVRNLAMASGRG
ncbi:hypothetical protein Tco_1297106, partial [Tanacetum coccineum]